MSEIKSIIIIYKKIEPISILDNTFFNGNVGIGTKYPASNTALDVRGNVKITGELDLTEGAFKRIATDKAETERLNKMTSLQKFRADAAAREKKHDAIAKNSGGMTSAIDRLEKHLNKEDVTAELKHKLFQQNRRKELQDKGLLAPEKPKNEEVEQIDEISKETLSSYRDKAMASNKNAKKNREASEAGKDMSKGFADLHAKSNAIVKKRIKGLSGYLQRKHGMKPGYEDERKQTTENTLDPQAATEAPKGPGEGITETQKQRSKSARIIKSIYKRKNMKEETYDWEKDDKTPQKLGKGVKLTTTDPKDSFGANKPEARIVMSGGKTMTGEKRDTVEIDPLMAKRTTPDDFDKPIGKKDK